MQVISFPNTRVQTGALILVNSEHGYWAEDTQSLVSVQEQTPAIQMQHRAVALLSKLMEDMQGWQHIVPVSGWRSFQEQQEIWDQSVAESGLEFTKKYVALPGHSEHQTGLAIDLGLKQETIDFICPEFPYSGICQVFREKAAQYGFIERYPAGKESITGIGHEPWHFRYVGIPHASIIRRMDLTLEEYHTFLKQFPYGKRPYIHRTERSTLEISYLSVDAYGTETICLAPKTPYTISGNNMDGLIITVWKDRSL